jgi:urease accessory protein
MTMQIVKPDPSWPIGKHALMNIHVLRRNGRTEIDPKSWRIPFQWQGCHYQDNDDQPFLLLINSGGGYVEGDATELVGKLERGARALITTTAASKFYKCPGGQTSREMVTLRAEPDTLLEFYPDESIPFANSRVQRRISLEIAGSTNMFAADMIVAGRIHHAQGEAFAFAEIDSEFRILVDGQVTLLDRLVARNPEEIGALRRLWSGAMNMATVVGHGSALPEGIEEAIETRLAKIELTSFGASRNGNMVICRILAAEAWACHEAIQACWELMRPSLAGKPARIIRKC